MSDDLTWRKSSYSSDTSDACLEVATTPEGRLRLRDSTSPSAAAPPPCLTFSAPAWTLFLAYLTAD